MLSLHRTLSLNYLSRHPTRMGLVVVTIALGVAVLVATQSLGRGVKEAIHRGFNPLAGLADLLIVNGDTGVPADLARQLREAGIKGVKDARPAVMAHVAVDALDNRWVLLLGLEAGSDEREKLADKGASQVRREDTFQGSLWQKIQEGFAGRAVYVDEQLAADLRAAKPDHPEECFKVRGLKVRSGGKLRELTILGTVRLEKVKTSENYLMTDHQAASALVFPDAPGTVGRIHVRLEEGAPVKEVSDRIKEWLGDRGQVETQEEFQAVISEVTGGLELGLAIGGAGALVVGLFLVYNVLSVGVAERRHDIGILRSVGATRGQISGLFMTEGAGLGLLGSALGLPLGMGLARLLLRRATRIVSDLLVPADDAQLHLSVGLMAFALLAGTAVAVLAALVPALTAAGEEPADAVRRVPRHHSLLLVVFQVGAVVLLVAGGMLFVEFRALLPVRFGVFAGIVAILLGALVAAPLLAGLVGRVIQPVFRYFLGLEGRLAADNLVRSPGRTGLVVAALAATGALMVQTAGFVRSAEEAIGRWLEEKIGADLFVTSGAALTSGSGNLAMDESLQSALAELPEVTAVVSVRYNLINFRQHKVLLVAADLRSLLPGAPDRPLARNLSRFPRFGEPGTCLVSENFAFQNGISAGDRFTIPGKSGQMVALEVLGTVEDYTWNRGTILLDRGWYRQQFADRQVDVLDVFLRPGSTLNEVRKKIKKQWGKQAALFVMTKPEIDSDVRTQLKRVYSLAYAQQTVVGMVALLGVVVALTISVLQRRRELGLLRAVGASRGQILRSVLAEAVLMGVTGAVVGFLIGLLLEWYVLDIMLPDEAGFSFPLLVPWFEAGVVFVLSVVFATLAGLWPAYHATQLRIPDAIAYE
jgi:putative ABC transport system permease protein